MKEYIVRIENSAIDEDEEFVGFIRKQPELIRCKDCKHRPKIDQEDVKNDTVDGFSFEFPDDFKCPCRCEDPYYNWMSKDDWYCGNGERKEE